MKRGFWCHRNVCLYEENCYLVEYNRATEATYLCLIFKVSCLKNKTVVLPINEIILQNV